MSGDKLLDQLAVLRDGLDTPGLARPLSLKREQALLDAALAERAAPPVRTRSYRLAAAAALISFGAAATLGAWHFTRPTAVVAPVTKPASAPQLALPAAPPATPAAEPQKTELEAPVRAETTPRPRTSGSSQPAAPEETDLLKRANDLRRHGDIAGAEKLYRQVVQAYPGTSSAYVAMSSVASLTMSRDPAGAAEIYRAARRARPAGALDLEIRQGLARAYRKLGQVAAERRELEALIAQYPKSEAAERAKQRLAEP